MPVHFAAARPSKLSPLGLVRAARLPLSAANDNVDGIGGERLLKAALLHFTEYGLGAAERARENAEAAFFNGDRQEYRWWMAICTALDRRMGAAVAFHRGSAPST